MTFLDRPDDEKWIFLSHSNADFEKVRLIRNHLEEKRCRPLMFYLKCLNSDEELFDLIKREIDARTRFVVCDSDNARLSKWVRKEIEYITSTEPKRSFLRLDLSKPVEELNRAVDSYILQMNLFISCLRKDESVVNVAKKRLGKYDLSIFKVDMLPAGCDFASYIRERMAKIIDSGFFVILVTKCPVSPFLKDELDFALNIAAGRDSKVFAVAISDQTEHYCLSDLRLHPEQITRLDGFGAADWPDRFADEILKKVYPLGSLKTFADNFRKAKDIQEAKKCDRLFIEEAERSINPGVMEYLANCYRYGWHGLPVDPYQERAWLSAAIHEAGSTDSLISRINEVDERISRMERDEKSGPLTEFIRKILHPAKTQKGSGADKEG